MPEGLHLKPLAEPNVRLSPHTAPASYPVSQRHASERTTVGRQPPSCVAIKRYAVCARQRLVFPPGPVTRQQSVFDFGRSHVDTDHVGNESE